MPIYPYDLKEIEAKRKAETQLNEHIRKATTIEETAPKRKHVRAAIVYTWDHKNSQSFWYISQPDAVISPFAQ